MMIFDLDGVIRDLHQSVMGFPAERQDNWHCRKMQGVDYCSIVNNDLSLLYEAPPTKYYPVIKKLHRVNILTCQPESWRPLTAAWIYQHFNFDQVSCVFVDKTEEKFDHIGSGDILVEDYPLFKDYSRIALIEYPYNKHVTGEFARIRTVEELKVLVEGNL